MNIKPMFEDTQAYKSFVSDFSGGRNAHAYLLICSDGIYLRNYLKLLAAAAMQAQENSREYRLIISERHTDCDFYPNAQFSALNVEFAAQVSGKSALAPMEFTRRVIVIDGAQTMNASAQNKLLKILEEPPAHILFIIGAVSSGQILPTVKSRMKTLTMDGYDYDKLVSWLISEGAEEGAAQTAAAASGAQAGVALDLCKNTAFTADRLLCREIITGAAGIKNSGYYADKIAASVQGMPKLLAMLKTFFRDIMAVHAGKEELIINKDLKGDIITGSKAFTLAAAANALEQISRAEKNLFYSATPAMQAEKLILEILKGKHLWQKL